ncbi:hypothetical protein Vafri_12504 [Volvox africanus]|uniref:Myb-like domain-containing protein n=1 Tax=Volvox africanus TaxID=51714 RepID=A0A8J4F4I0_9CHLO|nr:hypothetical protein Vafri_12504 [Volvox africanus]
MCSIFAIMDISPGPSAAVRVDAVGCRTSGRLRSQPLEFWRNEERPKDTAPQRLEFANPEAHRCRVHRRTLPVAQESVPEASDKLVKHQADSTTHAEVLHPMYDNAVAAASRRADLDISPGNVFISRTQREPVEEQEQPKRISKGSRGRHRKAEKVRDGASPGKIPAGHAVAATKPLPSVRLPSQRARRAAHAVAAADQTAGTHLSPGPRQADNGVAPLKGKSTQYEAGHHLGNAAPAVACAAPATITAAKAAGSGAAEVQSAVARGDAAKVLAAGTPVVKLCKRKARADPVLRSAILVRDVAAAVGQVAWPGSASDQDTIGIRRSRKVPHNVQSGNQTAAQKGSLGVPAAAPETAGTKMAAKVPARVQPHKPEDVNPAQGGADVVTKCDKEQYHTVGLARSRPTHQAALRDNVPPGAPLKMKRKSKSASNPKAKGNSMGSSAAAAGTRRPTRQQQLAPGPSLPAAQEPEQDVDEEEAYRPRKRARKATVQQPGSSDGRERMTAGVAGHEPERDPERTLYARVCTQPTATTVAKDCRQQAAKVGAAAGDESAARGQKKRGRKPTKASAVEAGIAAQPKSQPEPNIPSQQAAPVGAAGRTEEAGLGKAPGEALGAAPVQLQQTSVHSVMPSAGDGSPDCKAAGCAESPLQAAERMAPQVETPVQHQEEKQPVNQAGDQHIQQRPHHDPVITPATMQDVVEVPIEHGMGATAMPTAEAVPEPGMDGPYFGGRNLPATSPAITGDAAVVVFKVPAPRPRPLSPSESVVQSNAPWIRDEDKACNRQQDFLLQGIQKMTTERGPFGATVRMLARRLYCPERWRASAEATREKRLTHDNVGGTSQQPGTAQAAEVADRSGGTGNRQESGRIAEDSGPNAAAGPSQPTRQKPAPPLFNAGPSSVPNTNGGLAVHDAAQPGSSGRGLGRPLRDTDRPVRVTHGPLEASWFKNGTADPDTAVAMDSLPDPAPQLGQTAEQEHAHDHMPSWSSVQAAQMHPCRGQQQFYCSPRHNTHGQHPGEQSGLQQSWRRLKWQLPEMAHAEPCSQHRLQTVPNEAAEIQEPPHRPSPAPQQQQRDDVAQRSVQEELLWGRPAIDQPDAGQAAGQDPASQLHLPPAPPQQLRASSQGITRSLECAEPTKSQDQQRQSQLEQQFLVPRLRANRLTQQQREYSQSGELGLQQQQLPQRVPVADGRAVMYASHDLHPRRKSSSSAPALAPASAPSAAESLRRAFSRAGDSQKRIRTRQPDNIDSEEDGWTPDQVRDLQVAYYNIDPTLPNFWREVAKGVRGRTAAECFNRVFGSAQEREDRALFAKVVRRHNPAPAAGGGAGRPLTLAAARKRSQKAHEQELLERIARLERSDAESEGEADDSEQGVEDGPHAGGGRANDPSGSTGSRRRRLPAGDPMEVREILDDLKRTHHAHRFITSFLNKQGGWVKWHKAAKEASDHRLEAAGSAHPAGSNPNQAGPAARTVRPRNDSLTRFIGSMLSKETARKQRQEWREDDMAEGLDDEDDVYDKCSAEELEEDEDKERRMLLQYLVEEGLAEPDALPAL